MNDDSIFANYGSDSIWKTKRHYICSTGSFQLYQAIYQLAWRGNGLPVPREEEMKIMREFPYDIDPKCRCRDCRYVRMTRNWSDL